MKRDLILTCIKNKIDSRSVEDTLSHILDPIVPLGSPIVQTTVDQLLAVQVQLGISGHSLGVYPQLQLFYGIFPLLEAGHRHPTRRVHHFGNNQDLILMLPHGLEAPTLQTTYWKRCSLNFLK